MKNMTKRIAAILLALTMLLMAGMTGEAASKKVGKPKMKSAAAYLTQDGFGLEFRWKKVSGADGYQFFCNPFYSRSSELKDYSGAETTGTSVKIGLRDYGTVDFRVRAYRTTAGGRVYGAWATRRLKRSKVDALIVKQIRKLMKTKNLFMKALSRDVNVRSGAGIKRRVVVQLGYLDEVRATGKFKRDGSGKWWIQVYASKSQNKTVKGWVSAGDVEPVWY